MLQVTCGSNSSHELNLLELNCFNSQVGIEILFGDCKLRETIQ